MEPRIQGPYAAPSSSIGERLNLTPKQMQLMEGMAKSSVPEGKIHDITVKGVNYVIAKTNNGVVVQKESDFNSRLKTGIYIGKNGEISVPQIENDKKDVLEAISDFAIHLESKGSEFLRTVDRTKNGIIFPSGGDKIKPDDYVVVRTNAGYVVQKSSDYQKNYRTGLLIPNDMQKESCKFDGDKKCLDALAAANVAFRTVASTSGWKASMTKPSNADIPPPKAHVFTAKTGEPSPATVAAASVVQPKGKEPIEKATKIKIPSGSDRVKKMESIHKAYKETPISGAPKLNGDNLKAYVKSDDYKKHAQTAKVYHASYMNPDDCALILHQREPANLRMGENPLHPGQMIEYYDKEILKKTLNDTFEVSAFNDPKHSDRLKSRPNTVAVYSKTYLWPDPTKKNRNEIACLSLPAPPLDTSRQPHFRHYVQENGELNQENYKQEMETLARVVVQSCIENKNETFDGKKGIKRLVIPRYGQGAFLGKLNDTDKLAANKMFYESLKAELLKNKDALQGVEVVMSEFGADKNGEIEREFNKPLRDAGLIIGNTLNGDILKNARSGDLIVNAWDPHSVPGNGNEKDKSVDGALGSGTGITAVQSEWQNPYLRDRSRYRTV